MSETERIREANEQRYNVVNGHQWREKKSTVVGQYGGKRVTEWECQGCGKVSSSRNAGECTSPTLWVRLGCSRDGVGVCEDCEAVFLFDYGEQPFYEHGCPKCGSIEWYRDDDADADPDEVVGVPKTDGGSVEGDAEQTELVNLRDQDDWSDIVRIDRTTMFGNPHRLEEDGGEYTRESSVSAYELWFADRLEHGMPSAGPSAYEVEQAVDELRGATLGCWCAPKLCHGHVLLYYLDTGQTPRSVDELREWGAPEKCSVDAGNSGGEQDV